MEIHGKNHIGFNLSAENDKYFNSIEQSTQSELPEKFFAATDDEIEEAINLASRAFESSMQVSAEKRAEFLENIAEEILKSGDTLVERAMAETGLPKARIIGERGRTVNQLKMFAGVVRKGDWLEVSIDTAIPDRSPAPKPDLRMMRRPVGPVVVFTASNFPLAFSTAGGDTASALAAGNPVIVKCHESHPGTHGLVSDAIIRAAKNTGMPDGIFSSLQGIGFSLGEKLVKHPQVKSVAFTGSFKGGISLFRLAKEREEPIPVFAEMGSINPSFILPGKLAEDPEGLASTLAGSIMQGVGQFCTNPGVIVLENSNYSDVFLHSLAEQIKKSEPGVMLNQGIRKNFMASLSETTGHEGVEVLSKTANTTTENSSAGAIAKVSATDFIQNPELHEEVFGPFSLVVVAESPEESELAAAAISGQLTASVWCAASDYRQAGILAEILESRVGRVIFNNVPTGVEVCHSMHHGGPFPATTDNRFTSVGTDAIKRFSRPVCWQNCPEELLPDELKPDNPLNLRIRLNGEYK